MTVTWGIDRTQVQPRLDGQSDFILAALHCCGSNQRVVRTQDGYCANGFASLNISSSIMVVQLGAGGPQIAQTSAPHCLHSHLRASHSQVLPSYSVAIEDHTCQLGLFISDAVDAE